MIEVNTPVEETNEAAFDIIANDLSSWLSSETEKIAALVPVPEGCKNCPLSSQQLCGARKVEAIRMLAFSLYKASEHLYGKLSELEEEMAIYELIRSSGMVSVIPVAFSGTAVL